MNLPVAHITIAMVDILSMLKSFPNGGELYKSRRKCGSEKGRKNFLVRGPLAAGHRVFPCCSRQSPVQSDDSPEAPSEILRMTHMRGPRQNSFFNACGTERDWRLRSWTGLEHALVEALVAGPRACGNMHVAGPRGSESSTAQSLLF